MVANKGLFGPGPMCAITITQVGHKCVILEHQSRLIKHTKAMYAVLLRQNISLTVLTLQLSC